MLISANADLNVQDTNGDTALIDGKDEFVSLELILFNK